MGRLKVLVAGGGGFIGGHLVSKLVGGRDLDVRAADLAPLARWQQRFEVAENLQLDLRDAVACERAVDGVDLIYNLAADMGGMGYIESHRVSCMTSTLIDVNLLLAARRVRAKRYFYASTACVYPAMRQAGAMMPALREDEVLPADPERGYGWQKLFGEQLCREFADEGVSTRVARLHNVYGPHGTFDGGREKAPAAICRKVASAVLSGRHEIDIWGDGEQTRSFTYVDDCIDGIGRMMASELVDQPLNLGSSERVTINRLVDLVEQVAGVKLRRVYDTTAPVGVNGRSSDNALISELLGWEPTTPLIEGIARTYAWVYDQLAPRERGSGKTPRSAGRALPAK